MPKLVASQRLWHDGGGAAAPVPKPPFSFGLQPSQLFEALEAVLAGQNPEEQGGRVLGLARLRGRNRRLDGPATGLGAEAKTRDIGRAKRIGRQQNPAGMAAPPRRRHGRGDDGIGPLGDGQAQQRLGQTQLPAQFGLHRFAVKQAAKSMRATDARPGLGQPGPRRGQTALGVLQNLGETAHPGHGLSMEALFCRADRFCLIPGSAQPKPGIQERHRPNFRIDPAGPARKAWQGPNP
jgi:hypothetical protein